MASMRSVALMRLMEDGSFLYVTSGAEVKLRIRSVATGDDVVKAKASGASALAANVFLPEAVEVAKREGIELISIEDVADPLIGVIGALLKERRLDLLVRIFQELLPGDVARSYSYYELANFMGRGISSVSFRVKVEFRRSDFFEDILELLSALAAKASSSGLSTHLNSAVDPKRGERTIELEISL
ncbi:hypothetical protein Pogu_2709 [Pyrobaculum oguniense TE7]|uniref:Uncharacterized protein n=1 Tax=Pyrobaculum oguniense (strain DSM 13380 / JCM 10595 / TE7) TaxID=698757 RepID=H6QDW6_PYROT|nr:hypothetical protein Pogu_2709 [Pyrobaculum oguniense TE7]